MNANPFTEGHKFIIKEALKAVDFLYIFVVEEDTSEFSFNDRLNMVVLGTKEFHGKVGVFPSGKFIISSFTFPEYFTKSRLLNSKVDTSNDLALFGSVIAPELNITYRFVGEEPYCNITRQYNEEMKALLPALGIKLVEIARCKHQGEPISASLVREYLAQFQLEKLKKLVPLSTYQYLLIHFIEPALKKQNRPE